VICRVLFVVAVILLACGCISKSAGITTPEQVWACGKTTQREVVSKWGNPDRIRGKIWTWKEWRLIGGKVKASYMMVGLTVSNTQASTREYRLTFDDRGILAKQETADSVPGGASWSIWPW